MFDNGINRLDQHAQSRPLQGLEAAVWAELDRRAAQSRAVRTVATWQAAVMVLALVTSAGVGALAATQSPPPSLGVFSPRGALAPSTLLGGH
jgi:hypothetical protein